MISVESFFWKVAQSLYKEKQKIYAKYKLKLRYLSKDWLALSQRTAAEKILFTQGDRSDLHTVAALDKSDVPDLPAFHFSGIKRI